MSGHFKLIYVVLMVYGSVFCNGFVPNTAFVKGGDGGLNVGAVKFPISVRDPFAKEEAMRGLPLFRDQVPRPRPGPQFVCSDLGFALTLKQADAANTKIIDPMLTLLHIGQLSAACGFSMRTTSTDVVLLFSYNSCYVKKLEATYVLSLQWYGYDHLLSCPVKKPFPSVVCKSDAMELSLGDGESDDLSVLMNGQLAPLLSVASRCWQRRQPNQGALTFYILFSSCGVDFRDGRSILDLRSRDGSVTLSCPSNIRPSGTQDFLPKPSLFQKFPSGGQSKPFYRPINQPVVSFVSPKELSNAPLLQPKPNWLLKPPTLPALFNMSVNIPFAVPVPATPLFTKERLIVSPVPVNANPFAGDSLPLSGSLGTFPGSTMTFSGRPDKLSEETVFGEVLEPSDYDRPYGFGDTSISRKRQYGNRDDPFDTRDLPFQGSTRPFETRDFLAEGSTHPRDPPGVGDRILDGLSGGRATLEDHDGSSREKGLLMGSDRQVSQSRGSKHRHGGATRHYEVGEERRLDDGLSGGRHHHSVASDKHFGSERRSDRLSGVEERRSVGSNRLSGGGDRRSEGSRSGLGDRRSGSDRFSESGHHHVHGSHRLSGGGYSRFDGSRSLFGGGHRRFDGSDRFSGVGYSHVDSSDRLSEVSRRFENREGLSEDSLVEEGDSLAEDKQFVSGNAVRLAGNRFNLHGSSRHSGFRGGVSKGVRRVSAERDYMSGNTDKVFESQDGLSDGYEDLSEEGDYYFDERPGSELFHQKLAWISQLLPPGYFISPNANKGPLTLLSNEDELKEVQDDLPSDTKSDSDVVAKPRSFNPEPASLRRDVQLPSSQTSSVWFKVIPPSSPWS